MGHYFPLLRVPENFTFAISGAHHDTAGADAMRQLHVAMTISDHERARQVDAMFSRGLIQHAGARFSARASVGGGVRTEIDAVNMRSSSSQLAGHQIVDVIHERFRIVATSDSGLIGDHEDEKAGLV